MVVFVVRHVHVHGTGEDDVKFIGVYSSAQQAQGAVGRLLRQPGFSALPDGFEVTPYELDVDHWTEGYRTDDGC